MHNPAPADLLFRFGVISDIQYADIDDAMNFSKTETRTYRASLQHTRTAVQFWNALQPQPLFVAQLGDLLDGQNSGTYGQGLGFDKPQSDPALQRMLKAWSSCQIPVHHAIGNHELYNFSWQELRQKLNTKLSANVPHQVSEDEFYYHFQPYPGWRFVVLNPYEISVMQPEHSAGYLAADALLRANNPNYKASGKVDFFAGLEGDGLRFVPFNGGLSKQQLLWLKRTLVQAKKQQERVVVFTHVPLYAAASDAKNLAFNYDEVMQLLHNEGAGLVVAVLAGHCHRGGYAQDTKGIHHLTLQAPLTHGECFAYVDVFADHLKVVGQGKQRSYRMELSGDM